MKIIYTKHAKEKFSDLASFGVKVTKSQIANVISRPKYKSKDNGNKIAAGDFDKSHNLRVIYKIVKTGIIVITFYVYRKDRYGES